ncbi:MAG: FlgO family outer membrane protein [Pontibacterium sp.]
MKKLLVLMLFLSGCAAPWSERSAPLSAKELAALVAPPADVQPEPKSADLVGIGLHEHRYDPVSEAVALMARQLREGLQANRVHRLPMAIMPFVDLKRARERYTGELGDRLGDSFIYQLQQSDYNLIDYRAVSLLTTLKDPVTKQNMSGLRSRYRIYFLLTGTYARYPDGIVVNARVLDTTTRQVLATAQAHLPDVRLEGGTLGYDPLQALQKGMIIENSRGPVGY